MLKGDVEFIPGTAGGFTPSQNLTSQALAIGLKVGQGLGSGTRNITTKVQRWNGGRYNISVSLRLRCLQ